MSGLALSTKGDLINSALSKMGISGITAPKEPEDYNNGLLRLEGMMYEFEQARNICLGFNFTEPADLADIHGMNFGVFEPISTLLAVRLLSDYEIPASPGLIASSMAAVSAISAQTFSTRETQYPRRQPRGTGNTLRYNRWQRFYRKPARVPVDCSSERIEREEINDFSYSFVDYLISNETIVSFTIERTNGLRLISSRIDGPYIRYRIEGLEPQIDNGLEQLIFTITTSTGRIEKRLVNFEVLPITIEPPDRFIRSTS